MTTARRIVYVDVLTSKNLGGTGGVLVSWIDEKKKEVYGGAPFEVEYLPPADGEQHHRLDDTPVLDAVVRALGGLRGRD